MDAYSWSSVAIVGAVVACLLAGLYWVGRKSGFKGIQSLYITFAILTLNTIVAFVILNLVLLVFFAFRDSRKPAPRKQTAQNGVMAPASDWGEHFRADGAPLDNGRRTDYQLEWFDFSACESISAEFAVQVLDDFAELSEKGFRYQPWVQFGEPLFSGKHVNIVADDTGIPHRNGIGEKNPTNRPTLDIYVLGGSTTFGYNVADKHTWPSRLAVSLRKKAADDGLDAHVNVVNYGRGFYNPSQEFALLVDLLKSGHRPSLVIFMDGVNTGPHMDIPILTTDFQKRFRDVQFGESSGALTSFRWIPVVRLADGIRDRMRSQTPPKGKANEEELEAKERAALVSNRFIQSWDCARAVCERYGVDVMFCLQPSFAKYNIDLYRKPLPEEETRKTREMYRLVYAEVASKVDCYDFSDLYGAWGENRKAVLDDCHYTPAFNAFLARHVAEAIELENLPISKGVQTSQATGLPRSALNVDESPTD